LKTIDNNNNISPKSNLISAQFGVLKKLKLLYDSIKTFREQTRSQKFDINIKNSAKNGTFIININDIQNLKFYFLTPSGKMIDEKCDCLIIDEINSKIVLNYENDLLGNWSLYIQRMSIDNARDINFSIKAIII